VVQVFVTSTGRLLDVATILAQGQGAMAILSPGMQEPLLERLQKHIFPMDKVAVADITQQTNYYMFLL
jgi:tRNA-modifying protein YgfZ